MRALIAPIALVLVLSACGGDEPDAEFDPIAEATIAPDAPARPAVEEPVEDGDEPVADAEAEAARCEPVHTVPVQGGEHLIGDQEPPVPYNSTPPTSGWHASGAFEIRVFGPDEPLSEPRQVSVLEAGGAVVTYHDLPAADVAALEALADDEFPGRVAVTPYDALQPGQVALTAWATLQRCDGLDLDAVRAFVESYTDPAAEAPGH